MVDTNLSRVSSVRKNVKAKGLENVFCEAKGCTMQKDEDFKRKISVIQELPNDDEGSPFLQG